MLETLDLNPQTKPPTATVIWLHGLGADMYDFESIVPELGIADALGVRFVLPNAPTRPVALNAGMVMRAWFDITEISRDQIEDEKGIRESECSIRDLIARETESGVPPSRIVLAGFSQGGALAFQTALRHPDRLAGILALSTYLPLRGSLEAEASEANRDVPIFLAHGTEDPVVPTEYGRLSRRWLDDAGYPVEWHDYPMGHQVCLEEIEDIAAWLRRVLA